MKFIKKFLGLLKGGAPSTPKDAGTPQAVVVARDRHSVSRSGIDEDAKKVLNRLIRYNHTAYLVGGSVRDLLVGRKVKDFDIATSAHPNEVKALFRNCRLVGRRFRLAHILFRGGKVIEVSTFRRQTGFSDEEDLLIKSDNTFGNAEEDARRRDFTINGLFYNIADFTVIDYVGGLKDLEAGVIATIGDPEIRFREDPIRMLRALRLASRLQFTLETATGRALTRHRAEIWKGAVPRILEEVVRMLREGAAADSFDRAHDLGVLEVVLPRLAGAMNDEEIRSAVRATLRNLDRRPRPKEGLSPALLVSCLYFPLYRSLLDDASTGADRVKTAAELLETDLSKLCFPRLQFERAKQILAAQPRLESSGRRNARPAQLVRKAYFDDALSLFEMTRPASKESQAVLTRWRSLQKSVLAEAKGGEPSPRDGSGPEKSEKPRRRRRRRSPKKTAVQDSAAPPPGETT